MSVEYDVRKRRRRRRCRLLLQCSKLTFKHNSKKKSTFLLATHFSFQRIQF